MVQEAVDRAGSNPHLLFRLGTAYEEAGQPDRAVAAWERATTLGIGAEVKDAYYRLATAYERGRKPDAARTAIARAFFSVGHEFVTTGRATEALIPLGEATRADPQLAAAWFYLGRGPPAIRPDGRGGRRTRSAWRKRRTRGGPGGAKDAGFGSLRPARYSVTRKVQGSVQVPIPAAFRATTCQR